MTQETEEALPKISNRIAKIDEKQDKLLMYILGLMGSHIKETSSSVYKAAQDRLAFIIATMGLSIAIYALGLAIDDLLTRVVFETIGLGLLVYSVIQVVKLQLHMRDIDKDQKKTEEILAGIKEELKQYMTNDNEK